ncbi:MAG: TonB-dependent receptor [Acidobacteria bacterium]|nr:TonB-dependent receptor [Acidobacteriota bacterium]
MKGVLRTTALFLFGFTSAQAGEIHGRVMNAQGMPVPGVRVLAEKDRGTLRQEVLTSSEGTYHLKELEQGVYSLTVTAPAGGSVRRDIVVGTPDSRVRMDFQLPAAGQQAVSASDEGNPNIFAYRIDLNVARKRLTVVRGPNTQYIREFLPEQNYFGAEFGESLRTFTPLSRRPLISQWNSSILETFEHSTLNARPFFNVGPLRPSRFNQYQISTGGPLIFNKLSLTTQFGGMHNSGEVNGNVQVPKANERTPRSSDPQVNRIVASLLQAYPTDSPNLPYVSERQLNTNAPQKINSWDGLVRLDLSATEKDFVALRYTISDYSEDPFELVIGQNPQTDLRNQGLHASWTRTVSPSAVGRVGFHFDRSKAILAPTKRFQELFAPLGGGLVPDVDYKADSFQDLGPGKIFPRKRIQNLFQFYGDFTKIIGRHALKMGWGTTRSQVNDLQSDNTRGTLAFFDDSFGDVDHFGNPIRHSEIDNFLSGRASQLTITQGNLYRGFRSWEHTFYFGDQIRLTPTFSLNLGLRYELATAPTEVNDLTDVGYSTDANNFGPSFGFAWNPKRGKTTIRAGYAMYYGSVFPVTYQFARFNPPAIQVLIQVPAPPLTNLLSIPTQPASSASPRPSLNTISPDLVTPYSHMYNLAIERSLPSNFSLRLAYIGTRSFHLFRQDILNRARPSTDPAIPNTTSTVDLRRADSRYTDVNVIESNGNSYYDAAQISLEKRLSHGLTFRASYTFSKNIDVGADFTNTASGVEKPPEMGIRSSELVTREDDMKGVSIFDTPHAFVISYTYAFPSPRSLNGWKAFLLQNWEVSGTTIFQSGIPWHAHTGDGPRFGNVDGVSHDRPNIRNTNLLGISFDDPDTSRAMLGSDEPCVDLPTYRQCKYFDTNIPVGGRGNVGFNVFRKDGSNNFNLSVAKTFRYGRRREMSFQVRGSFLNFLNHAQFDKPTIHLTSPTFGVITNTVNKGRVTQLSLRVTF